MTKIPKEMVNKIKEGISSLKKRTDFNSLTHRDRLGEIEVVVEKFEGPQNLEAISHALSIFRETSGPTTEASKAYDNTIWDVNVLDEKATLSDLFIELEEEYKKIQRN